MSRVHRALAAVVLLLAAARLPADDDPLAWANAVRSSPVRDSPAPALRHDPLLSTAARAYAAELAAAGVLSHAGPADASSPLARVFRAGGTAFEVGEILGVGPDLAAVERAWEASPPHRRVVENDRYTAAGWGVAKRAAQQVWVLVFARSAVVDLRLEAEDGELAVSGSLGPAWAAEPWLDAGSGALAPAAWDRSTRRFAYRVPLVDGRARLLLGALDASGDRHATDSVTWPPGTGSPAGRDRWPAPAPPP